MPFLINTVLRRWLLTAIAVPLAAAGARRIARSLEARRGRSTTVTRGLAKAADTVDRKHRDAESDAAAPGRRRGLLRGRR